MGVTSGFFDSTQDVTRAYTAEQFSSIFDGLITDGVYEGYPGGTRNGGQKIPPFEVTAVSGQFKVNVGPGRAWFNHVWVLNDNTTIDISAANGSYDRYDTISIEINKTLSLARFNYSPGTPDGNNAPNEPVNTDSVFYYPIARVVVPKNTSSSSGFRIYSRIGVASGTTIRTPLVQAIVGKTTDLTQYLADYAADLAAKKAELAADIQVWEQGLAELLDDAKAMDYGWLETYREEVDDLKALITGEGESEGGSSISSQIGQVATDLSDHITESDSRLNTLEGYFNTALPAWTDVWNNNINSPKATICRIKIGSGQGTGTKPSIGGNQVLLLTMHTDANALYNAQLVFGYSYTIGLRYKHNGTWQPWRYLDFPSMATVTTSGTAKTSSSSPGKPK